MPRPLSNENIIDLLVPLEQIFYKSTYPKFCVKKIYYINEEFRGLCGPLGPLISQKCKYAQELSLGIIYRYPGASDSKKYHTKID